ncbi:hypothetical protein P7K49_032383 [Saguinus oedipus]|uniref:Uncharacterized protein n=1 Tax=Saguinus oedipus TaxID=9490 RepID=A0ABQ9TY31_SAGOE|nr:hypothetical protein P7K49_032383 [Saguinus oedipus]
MRIIQDHVHSDADHPGPRAHGCGSSRTTCTQMRIIQDHVHSDADHPGPRAHRCGSSRTTCTRMPTIQDHVHSDADHPGPRALGCGSSRTTCTRMRIIQDHVHSDVDHPGPRALGCRPSRTTCTRMRIIQDHVHTDTFRRTDETSVQQNHRSPGSASPASEQPPSRALCPCAPVPLNREAPGGWSTGCGLPLAGRTDLRAVQTCLFISPIPLQI